jgi:hypothetical protein
MGLAPHTDGIRRAPERTGGEDEIVLSQTRVALGNKKSLRLFNEWSSAVDIAKDTLGRQNEGRMNRR